LTHPALGDLDGDEDLIWLSESDPGILCSIAIREHSSRRLAIRAIWFCGIFASTWAYPALGDINNDGAVDLMVGRRTAASALL